MRDNIYSSTTDLVDFCFNESVVKVFDDMVNRSVPGYLNTIETIRLTSQNYYKKGSNIYDLGCSTGATSISMHSANYNIIAIDNSIPMIEKCKKKFIDKKYNNIKFICDDIVSYPIKNASIVVLNLTLQFIEKQHRQKLIDKIYNGLNKGGVLFISEKIHFNNELKNELITNLHLNFKKSNGYSELEIANKRQALDNILLTDDDKTHLERFKKSGFQKAEVILQNLNFYGFIAIK